MILILENEVDPTTRYFVPEIRRHLEAAGAAVRVYPFADRGGRPDALEAAEGVVLSGSTAGVYESADHPWMDDLRELVRELVSERVPTLGVCFGHQLVNDALGGTVEHRGLHAGIDPVRFADDPLFDGVGARVPLLHGDVVTELGAGMEAVASADYYDYLGSRHRDAPLWTVQYHPEFTELLLPDVEEDFEWPADRAHRDFDGVTVERTFENFVRLVDAR
jgi:GMP synthase (glutamine-hydrolysing)